MPRKQAEENKVDKRRETSKKNMLKAQQTKAQKQREAKKEKVIKEGKKYEKEKHTQTYDVESESESSESEEEQIILKVPKNKKSKEKSNDVDILRNELNQMKTMIQQLKPKQRKPTTRINIVNPPAQTQLPPQKIEIPIQKTTPIVEELQKKILLNFN